MKFFKDISLILPSSIVWLLTVLFLLVFSFDLLNSNPYLEINQNLLSPGAFLLFITACVATVFLYVTGIIIDKNPNALNSLITGSLLMSGICLYCTILGVNFIVLILVGLPALGVFLGILATASNAQYSGHIDVHYRGRVYAGALFISAIISVCTIIIVELVHMDFQVPLFLIGSLAIGTGILFHFTSRSVVPWVNDKFPTPLNQIVNRRSVKAYLVTHFLVFLMLGIAFTSISQIGQDRYTDFPFLDNFLINPTRLFWFFVFLGDLLFVLPMGWFSDKRGRKNTIVIGVYGIVIAALIVGLSDNSFMFYFAAFLLGASFASMHPSLDSAVWSDLSPLDSVGRYNALGLIFLLQGVIFGLIIGLFILPSDPSTISYILIGCAVLGLFPLFFVADSFEPLDIFLLLVTTSGMCMFTYDFGRPEQTKITQKDLTLVAGALSAISSFFESLDQEHHAVLDLVHHGSVFTVQAKAGTEEKELVGTLIANKIDPELQNRLETFLARFCISFHNEINEWIGQMKVFESAVEIAEDVFGPLRPSKTILSD